MTQEKKIIQPAAAAAAMMRLTMTSVESHWSKLQPLLAAFMPDAKLTETQEDAIIQELYMAALSLELYDLSHVVGTETGQDIESEMINIMQTGDFEPLQLLAPIRSVYLPRLQGIRPETHSDLGMSLITEAAGVLYERLPLPLKPAEREKNLLWMKLVQILPLLVGKWPLLVKSFKVAPAHE